MGTIADKLAKLNVTKADLKAALAEKGQTVGDVFSTYPAAVRAIEGGGAESVVVTYSKLGLDSVSLSYTSSDYQLKENVVLQPGNSISDVLKGSLVLINTTNVLGIFTHSGSAEEILYIADRSGPDEYRVVYFNENSDFYYSYN